MGKGFAVVDLETTGLSPYEDEIIEIAILLLDPNNLEETDRYHTLIRPTRHTRNPARHINLIREEQLESAPTFEYVADSIKGLLSNRKIVGQNFLGFDLHFLNMSFSPINYSIPTFACIDTLLLARTFLQIAENNKLPTLAKYFGIDYEDAHMAIADVDATSEVFKRFYAQEDSKNFIDKVFVNYCKNVSSRFRMDNWHPRPRPTLEHLAEYVPLENRTHEEQDYYYYNHSLQGSPSYDYPQE